MHYMVTEGEGGVSGGPNRHFSQHAWWVKVLTWWYERSICQTFAEITAAIILKCIAVERHQFEHL